MGDSGTGAPVTGAVPSDPPTSDPEPNLDRSRPSLLVACVWARKGGAERVAVQLLRALGDVFRVALGVVRPLPPGERTLEWEGPTVGLREVLFGSWDVIHTHLFVPGLLVRLRRVWDGSFRWVHTVHYDGYDHLALGRLKRWIDHHLVFGHADALVAVSPSVRASLAGRFPRVELVENAVDLAPPPGAGEAGASGRGGESGPAVVGTVAMLRPEKGIGDLLRAIPALRARRPGLRVRIAGEGPERPALERTAAELGVGEAVEFCGFVEDLDRFYRGLDAYVQPSRTESFGLAVADALRHGIPVVAARVGNLPDLLADGRFGLLVDRDAGFPERLARGVDEALGEAEDHRRRALEGARHWRRRLDPGRMAAEYRELYRRVMLPRICMVQPVVTHAGGGLARQLLLQSRELAGRGHRVFLVQRRDPELEADPERRARWAHVEVRETASPGGGERLRGLAFALLGALELWRLRRRIDVIHAHQLYSPTLAGAAASLLAGLPLVVKVTASGPLGEARQLRERLPLLPLRRLAFRRIRGLLVLGETMAREMEGLGFGRERLWRVPNCVELPDEPEPRPRSPDGPFRLLFTGRLSTEKDLPTLLDAAEALAARGHSVEVELVGAPDPERDAEPELRRRARALEGRVAVAFRGFHPDPGPFYRRADAFVLPSRSEGMSNALLEALAHGLPCVVSGIPENVEVVAGGSAGLTFPPGDAEALADRVERLIRDRRRDGSLIRRLSRAGREEVRRRFSVGAVADRLEAVYRAVGGSSPSPPP